MRWRQDISPGVGARALHGNTGDLKHNYYSKSNFILDNFNWDRNNGGTVSAMYFQSCIHMFS